MNARAFILAGLLWCLVLLTVVVIGTLHSAQLGLRVGKNHGDRIQARYLALAGVETTKALLYHDAMERRDAGRNHTGRLYDEPEIFADIPLGPGRFSVMHPERPDAAAGYGVVDEESRINVNTASAELLDNLEGIDATLAASLLAFREQRNPFRTLRELLLVEGMSPPVLLGAAAEDTENPAGPERPIEDGLAARLTVHSGVHNLNAAGENRINLRTASEDELAAVPGITSEIAGAIVAHRGQNNFGSVADLLDVRLDDNASDENGDEANGGASSSGGASGEAAINENTFMEIADALTVDDEAQLIGRININTAAADVLAAIPELERELAYAIVSHRQSQGFFESPAELLRVPGMDHDILKSVFPLFTARSDTFRIVSEGVVDSTGARVRIHTVVRVGAGTLDTLFYKEDET
jgi:DNA uptake protein ComE-like DNA-binding protein